MRLFLYLLIVMSAAIGLFGNVFIGIMVAVLYGVAISGIAIVCYKPEEDEWKR